jgi:hypothetical protein
LRVGNECCQRCFVAILSQHYRRFVVMPGWDLRGLDQVP